MYEHTRGVRGHAPPRNLKFRSSKTAGNAPKTRILLILSLSMGMHPAVLWYKQIALHGVHAAKIGSARARSRRVQCHNTLQKVLANIVLFFFLVAFASCHEMVFYNNEWIMSKIQVSSFKFIFSLDFNNILSRNPFHQEVLLRNHFTLPHYFLMLLPLVALFALKQIIHTKNKFAFHHVYSWC